MRYNHPSDQNKRRDQQDLNQYPIGTFVTISHTDQSKG